MTREEDPDLEDALDALQVAEAYAESIGCNTLARGIAQHYQALGDLAPDDHWEPIDDPDEFVEWGDEKMTVGIDEDMRELNDHE